MFVIFAPKTYWNIFNSRIWIFAPKLALYSFYKLEKTWKIALLCQKLKRFFSSSLLQKSSLGENWPSPAVKLHSGVTNEGLQGMKYVVYKQPLSLDRFFIHEVSTAEANMAKLENAFILINLNRFQQIVSVQTFQAESEQLKVNKFSSFRENHIFSKIHIFSTM